MPRAAAATRAGIRRDALRAEREARAAVSPRRRFENLLDRHESRLRRVAFGMLGDAHRVDDVLQEAFLKAYRALPDSFENEQLEAAWLYRIVHRCCLDELRGRKRRREVAGVLELLSSEDEQDSSLVVAERSRGSRRTRVPSSCSSTSSGSTTTPRPGCSASHGGRSHRASHEARRALREVLDAWSSRTSLRRLPPRTSANGSGSVPRSGITSRRTTLARRRELRRWRPPPPPCPLPACSPSGTEAPGLPCARSTRRTRAPSPCREGSQSPASWRTRPTASFNNGQTFTLPCRGPARRCQLARTRRRRPSASRLRVRRRVLRPVGGIDPARAFRSSALRSLPSGRGRPGQHGQRRDLLGRRARDRATPRGRRRQRHTGLRHGRHAGPARRSCIRCSTSTGRRSGSRCTCPTTATTVSGPNVKRRLGRLSS